MKNRYYTPELSEFHWGYECEILSSYGWQEGIFPDILFEDTLIGFTAQKDIFKAAEKASIRTKYLDREDIESLGFEYKRSVKDTDFFTRGEEFIGYNFNTNIFTYDISYEPTPIKIKNKSEFKKLLAQLRIQ